MNSTIFLGRLRSKTTYALNNSIHFLDKIDVLFRIKYKQWPLAGKFVEFEYSPKICQFWRIRVLAKMTILENRSDSIHSPDICQPFCLDSIHFGKFGASGHCLHLTWKTFYLTFYWDLLCNYGFCKWKK